MEFAVRPRLRRVIPLYIILHGLDEISRIWDYCLWSPIATVDSFRKQQKDGHETVDEQ